MTSSEQAAWVQALGSIAAVVVAGIGIMATVYYAALLAQTEREKQWNWQVDRADAELVAERTAIISSYKAAAEMLRGAAKTLRPGAMLGAIEVAASMMGGIRPLLDAVPLQRLRDSTGIVEFSRVSAVLADVERGLSELKTKAQAKGHLSAQECAEEVRNLELQANGIEGRIADFCKRLSLENPASFRQDL